MGGMWKVPADQSAARVTETPCVILIPPDVRPPRIQSTGTAGLPAQLPGLCPPQSHHFSFLSLPRLLSASVILW